MKKIPLANNKGYALVDDEDYERAMQYRWSRQGGEYAHGMVGEKGRRKLMQMHRWLIGAPKGMDVDHINMNKLDNRKRNLRVCTRSQNKRNVGVRVDNNSGYKGVGWSKQNKGWMARIVHKGKTFYLGTHNTPEEAARFYDEAAKKYHGEFAWLNFPED